MSGSRLSKFLFKIYQKLKPTILPGEGIILLVSGGVDSMAMAHSLEAIKSKIGFKTAWIHFNHGLREESCEEEEFVRTVAKSYKVPFKSIRRETPFLENMQAEARVWRYYEARKWKDELGFTRLSTGHQADDVVETVLWKIIRGSSLIGLSALKFENEDIIRPCLDFKKNDLIEFMNSQSMSWRQDNTNQKSDYTRNAIRNQLIPLLTKIANSDPTYKIIQLAKEAELMGNFIITEQTKSTLTSDELPISWLLKFPDVIIPYIVSYWLSFHLCEGFTRIQIKNLVSGIRHKKTGNCYEFPQGINVLINSKSITLKR